MSAFKYHPWLSLLGALLLCIIATVTYQKISAEPTWTTTLVERGDVTEIVGISGFVETEDAAELSFPAAGLVTDVFVVKGDIVEAGQLLATLGSQQLVAERAAAVAILEEANASRNELRAGPTSEARAVTKSTVASATRALEETKATEAEKVKNVYTALLSNELAAASTDVEERAAAPLVTGSYSCTAEGVYILDVYASAADSGYSYALRGLEGGTGTVSLEQPAPLGSCGLFLEFDDTGLYNNSTWQVTIPNLRSGSYTTYKNAFELAVRQKDQNIRAAEDALAIALNEATARNAAPRVESLVKANATVQAAEAKIAAIDAQIANASIAAPFTGTITDVSIVSGETANLNPVITILGNTPFTLTARVPEIDITKIFINQTALVAFDAKSDETFTGVVSFVSPLPTTIDGVAYFDATITLTDTPTWIRAGLNADVDITLKRETDVLRVPERFLTTASEGYTVRLASSKTATPTLVEVLFIGNDGYASITGLNEGDIIIAPEK